MKSTHVAYVFVLLLISMSIAACAGLDMGNLIKVETPPDVSKAHGVPSRTSLNDAEHEYAAWLDDTQRNAERWRTNIERGNEIRGVLSQLTLQALDSVGPTLAGVPVLGPALPALTGLAGLFLGVGNRLRREQQLRKEKEDSYNAGIAKGKELNALAKDDR